jgi:hypothetical protein
MEEVEKIIKDVTSRKVHGPDGFTSDFFQACWIIIGRDILTIVEKS